MVDWSEAEQAFLAELDGEDLQWNRDKLDNHHSTQEKQCNGDDRAATGKVPTMWKDRSLSMMVHIGNEPRYGQHRDGESEQGSDGERAGVAHEDLGLGFVEKHERH